MASETVNPNQRSIEEFIAQPAWRRDLWRRYGQYPADDELPPPAEIKTSKRGRKRSVLVYFIQSHEGSIKIGKSSDVPKRLRQLQSAHAHPLRLLALTQGGGATEEWYHYQFREHRLSGEWFKPHPDILAEIERLTHERPEHDRA